MAIKIRREDALNYHMQGQPGKIEVVPTKVLSSQIDLALAYSPGVAEPCKEIFANKEDGVWTIPKGMPDDPAEDLLACAKREFREETGLTASAGVSYNWSTGQMGEQTRGAGEDRDGLDARAREAEVQHQPHRRDVPAPQPTGADRRARPDQPVVRTTSSGGA